MFRVISVCLLPYWKRLSHLWLRLNGFSLRHFGWLYNQLRHRTRPRVFSFENCTLDCAGWMHQTSDRCPISQHIVFLSWCAVHTLYIVYYVRIHLIISTEVSLLFHGRVFSSNANSQIGTIFDSALINRPIRKFDNWRFSFEHFKPHQITNLMSLKFHIFHGKCGNNCRRRQSSLYSSHINYSGSLCNVSDTPLSVVVNAVLPWAGRSS